MLVGSSIWAYIVGSICGVVSSLDAQTLQFRRTMDELNYFMKDEHLPKEMRQRLREYFHQRRALTKALSYQNLLVQMSPSLRQEVAFHINRRWLRHVTWFQRASKDFVSAVAVHLVPAVYAPKELVHGDEFSIVVRGVAAKEGKILTQGDTWGDDIILASSEFRRATPARALTYLEVKSMSQEDLATVLDAFPEEALRIRKIANRLLLRRAFIREAQRRKTLRKEEARLRLGRRPPRSPAGSDGGGGSGSGGGGDVKGGVTAHHTPDAEDESKSVDVARTASAGGEEGGVGGDEARRGIRPTPGPALVPRVAPAWVQGKDRPTQGKPPESTVVAGSAPSSASPAGGPPAAAHSAPAPAPTSSAVLAPGSPAAPAPAPPAERGAAAASAGSAATREDAESRVDDLGVPFGSLVPVVVQTDRSGRESTVLPHRLGEGGPVRHQLGTGTDSPASGPLAASVRADVSAAVSAELQVLRSELRTALATIAAATQQAQRDAGRPAPPVAPMSTQTSTQTRQAPRQRTDPAEKEGGERQRERHRAEAPSEAQASGPRPAAARRSRRQRGQLARQGSVFAWEMEGRRQRAAPLRGLGVEGEAPSGGDRQGVRIRPPPSARDLSKYDSMHLLGRR